MCLLIFIRISAATLRGRQTKLCNFTEILKAQKLKISRRPSINRTFYCVAPLGFGIAEYNDRPITEKKNKKNGGSVPENGRKSRKMKSIVPDLSEKIMACMIKGISYLKKIIAHFLKLNKSFNTLCRGRKHCYGR